MIRDRSVFRFLTASAVVLVALASTANILPAGAAKVPKVKMQTVQLAVDLSGFMEVQELHDTTSKCFPGIRYLQTVKTSYESLKPVTVKIQNISVPGTTGVVTSFDSPAVGLVKVTAGLSDQSTTNFCDGKQGELPPFPNCVNAQGPMSISILQGGEDDGELVSLNGKPMNIAIMRTAGPVLDPTCPGRGADSLRGNNVDTALISTSMAPRVPFIIVPTSLGSLNLFTLAKGKKLLRDVTFFGPCTNVSVESVPSPGAPAPAAAVNADGDCFLTGKMVITISRK